MVKPIEMFHPDDPDTGKALMGQHKPPTIKSGEVIPGVFVPPQPRFVKFEK